MDRDDFIGESVIPLATFDFHLTPIHTAWYTLRSEVCHKSIHTVPIKIFTEYLENVAVSNSVRSRYASKRLKHSASTCILFK